MKPGTALVGMLNPFDKDGLQRLATAGLTSLTLEAAPRTTRAQSMDVLSSQANIAGYKAVMMAADKYQLVSADMVKSMKPGSVIVDIAAGKGLPMTTAASAATAPCPSPTRRSSSTA